MQNKHTVLLTQLNTSRRNKGGKSKQVYTGREEFLHLHVLVSTHMIQLCLCIVFMQMRSEPKNSGVIIFKSGRGVVKKGQPLVSFLKIDDVSKIDLFTLMGYCPR